MKTKIQALIAIWLGLLTLESRAATGGGSGTGTGQPPSQILTNISLTGAITNAPWTTNLHVGLNLGAAVSNLPNNSVANILPGVHTVTPVITFTNAGVVRFPPLTLLKKTNITLNVFGTIDGSSTLGEIMFITNCSRITINGHNSGVFIGSRQTNIATLIPTNVTWSTINYYYCDNLTFKNFSISNSHYHGIADWGGGLGTVPSTNNILFEGLDIRFVGSKTTNASSTVDWDGAAIVLSGGTVRNCYLRDNFRGVEVYTQSGNALTDNTVVEGNHIYDTLDAPFTTSGSTNNNKIQVFNNFIYQTKGYSRLGTNYVPTSSGCIIRMDGGHGHTISKNKVFGTNAVGIYVGGNAGANIEVSDNYVEGPDSPILWGLDSVVQGQHRFMVCRGNTIRNTAGGYKFFACRDGLVAYNKASEFTQPFAMGFDFLSPALNTNMFVVGNTVKDTSGNLYASYILRAGNDRIILSDNDGTNGTQSFVENLAGSGLIMRGQRNNAGLIEHSENLIITNSTTGVSIQSPLFKLAAGGGQMFELKVEDGTNRITSPQPILIDMGALGTFGVKSNAFFPPQNNSTTLGTENTQWSILFAGGSFMSPTNGNETFTKVANSNAIPVTNIVGLVERGSGTPIIFDCNLAHQYVITNRISAASTYVFTNTWRGQEYKIIVPGEVSGGVSRVITLVPTLGDLVANLSVFGTALATSGSFTLTNGNAAEVCVRVSRFNGTNIFGFSARQYAF